MTRPLRPGDVVVARFPEHRPPGREQYGLRPAIVVALPGKLGALRFPLIFVTPLTTDHGQAWATASPRLYPRLGAGVAGLPSDSIALIDQTRAVSAERVSSWLGVLEPELYSPIREALSEILSR